MKFAIFLGSISAAIGVLAILLSLGLFGPAPSFNQGKIVGSALPLASHSISQVFPSSFKPCSPAAIRLPRNCQLQRLDRTAYFQDERLSPGRDDPCG